MGKLEKKKSILSCITKVYLLNSTSLYAQWEALEIAATYTCTVNTSGFLITQTATGATVRGGWSSGASANTRAVINVTGYKTAIIDAYANGEGTGNGGCQIVGKDANGATVCSYYKSGKGITSGTTLELNGATTLNIYYYVSAYEGGDGYDGPYYGHVNISSVTLKK